ncbi:alpha/beta hydrolase [Nocardioides albidus]|uniref:Alpha/beta hydrolase n=1 Tax=Nocardioides albidus TaxID=1517589 RepID=A0A5C4VKY0_9ACTN|nr:alpha/beta fold hydrolase [Nocardioides albidus]TNM36500.1 alpha/beta hydrolase [Nocardioides albidus]
MSENIEYRAPSRALLWTEAVRANVEAHLFAAALPALAAGPQGDGHHVLVLPGLLADDQSTRPLRRLLQARGFQAHAWRLGLNIGPTRRIHEGMVDRLRDLHDRDGAPVSIIGWSLGGLLARELARLAPEHVRSVITLGSPLRLSVDSSVNASHASKAFHLFRPWHVPLFDGPRSEEERTPLTMPATSVYSRLDGVVPWAACLDLEGPLRENVQVSASHLGMGTHPEVARIVLDRLAQPVGAWQPYADSTAALGSGAR